MPKINVIGMGYIGLPTALMFATHGMDVVGSDHNIELIKRLQSGKATYDEKGLNELYEEALNKGIRFSNEYITTDIYIIAVPTPYDKVTKKIDTGCICAAVESITEVCQKGATIVIESTVSPGTIDKYVRPIIESKGFIINKDINLVHAPERIIPGNMIYELKNNSRTIGADSPQTGERIKELYATFCKGNIVVTDIRTAEMTKVVENTYRDVNIAFANELAKICRSDGMDVYEIIRIANMHPRVNILNPGPGVGGHCISVDPWFLVGDYPELANIILQARKTNDSMPEFVIKRIFDVMKDNKIEGFGRVGIYGITYKENVDDVRESPTLQMFEKMDKSFSGSVKFYDPYVKRDIFKNQYHDFNAFLEDIDLIVIMVGHDEIKNNQDKIKDKIILDTRKACTLEGINRL